MSGQFVKTNQETKLRIQIEQLKSQNDISGERLGNEMSTEPLLDLRLYIDFELVFTKSISLPCL